MTTPKVSSASRPGRRIVAGVGGELQEVVGLVGPELRHHRIGVDDGIGELAADALHLEDVHVLRRVARLVELDGSPRVLDGLARLLDGGEEALAVLDAALPIFAASAT